MKHDPALNPSALRERATAHRAMAVAALRTDSSLANRLRRYNHHMTIAREFRQNAVIVALSGRIDAVNAKELQTLLIETVSTRSVLVVVDMARMSFMTSAGLRVLLIAARRAKTTNSRIVLAAMPANVRPMFETSAFTSLFEVHADADAAMLAHR